MANILGYIKNNKYLRRAILGIFVYILSLATSTSPSFAAKQIIFRYGLFEESVSVTDLHNYADGKKASSNLQSLLDFFNSEQQKSFHQALQVKIPLELGALDKVLNTELAQGILATVSQSITRNDQAGVQAIDAAIILGANSPTGLGIISFLEAYPSSRLVINIPAALEMSKKLNLVPTEIPPKDNLSSTALWQLEVQYQEFATQGKKFSACLFGDSVTAELGNTLNKNTFNFALNGISGISLVEQLKLLNAHNIKCEKAVIAIGGNDAWYGLSDEMFAKKLQESISLAQSLGSKKIFLIPAFYSTVLASQDPSISATNPRVTQINTVMQQVAIKNNIPLAMEQVKSLNQNEALKDSVSSEDGAHLNNEGLNIYRQALLKILGNNDS